MKIRRILIGIMCLCMFTPAIAQKKINTETRQLGHFRAFNFYGAAKIYLIQGNEEKIILAGKRNLDVSRIKTEIRGGKLYITSKRPKAFFNPRLKIHIYYKTLEEIEIEGKAKVEGKTPLKSEQLSVILMGSGRTYLDVETKDFKAHLIGAGSINVKGKAKNQYLTVDGAGVIRAMNLKGTEARVQINGAGSIFVYATERLRAGVSGVGTIRYKGDPVSTKFSKEGVGTIRPIN